MFDVFFLKDSKYNWPTVYFFFGNMKEMADDFYQMTIGHKKVSLVVDCISGEIREQDISDSSKLFDGSKFWADEFAKNNISFAEWMSGKEGLFYHRTFSPNQLENTNVEHILSEDEIVSILNGNFPEEEYDIDHWQRFVEWYKNNMMFCSSVTIDKGYEYVSNPQSA